MLAETLEADIKPANSRGTPAAEQRDRRSAGVARLHVVVRGGLTVGLMSAGRVQRSVPVARIGDTARGVSSRNRHTGRRAASI
jgi:hypothetical protein